MHALRNIRAALASDGIVVDTQPVSARPEVASDSAKLGTLDMRDWLDTIHAVDERIMDAIEDGLYELRHESRFTVTDSFDNGPDCLETVSGWRGTRVPPGVAQRLAAATSAVTVEQQVRLRLLRRTSQQRAS